MITMITLLLKLTACLFGQANIRDYGGDPENMFLVGHSAGGHAVGLLAVHPTLLTHAGVNVDFVRGVVPIGAARLVSGDRFDGVVTKMLCCSCFCSSVRGGGTVRAHQELSPLWHVRQLPDPRRNLLAAIAGPDSLLNLPELGEDDDSSAGGAGGGGKNGGGAVASAAEAVPNMLLLTGSHEYAGVVRRTPLFHAAARAKGIACEAVVVPGEAHMSEILRVGLSEDGFTPVITSFIRSCRAAPSLVETAATATSPGAASFAIADSRSQGSAHSSGSGGN